MSVDWVDWGTAPDWIAAIATAGAFGYALWLVRQTVHDRRKAEQRELEAQASRITAWIDWEVDPALRTLQRAVVRVRNG